jgi:hypothetical protein
MGEGRPVTSGGGPIDIQRFIAAHRARTGICITVPFGVGYVFRLPVAPS